MFAPKVMAMFYGVIHPFAAFDLMNDNTAGGTIDVLKYTQPGQDTLQRGIQGYRVIEMAGVRWIETTTVPTSANFPSSGKTGYHSYVVGMNAVSSLCQSRRNRSSWRAEFPAHHQVLRRLATVADPANVIGASVAYNFRFGAIRRPGTTMALRRIRKEVSIT
jgi:hypothetical protein